MTNLYEDLAVEEKSLLKVKMVLIVFEFNFLNRRRWIQKKNSEKKQMKFWKSLKEIFFKLFLIIKIKGFIFFFSFFFLEKRIIIERNEGD